MRLRSFAGRNEGELFRGVANDFALRQRLLQFINLCLGEVGVAVLLPLFIFGTIDKRIGTEQRNHQRLHTTITLHVGLVCLL